MSIFQFDTPLYDLSHQQNLERHERFKDAREIYNKNGKQTVEVVAKNTGLQRSMISSLESETSNRRVNAEDIAKLAKYYGVSTDYLLGLTNYPKAYPEINSELGLTSKNLRFLNFLNRCLNAFFYDEQSKNYIDLVKQNTPNQDVILFDDTMVSEAIKYDILDESCRSNLQWSAGFCQFASGEILNFLNDIIEMFIKDWRIAHDYGDMFSCDISSKDDTSKIDFSDKQLNQRKDLKVSKVEYVDFKLYWLTKRIGDYFRKKYISEHLGKRGE